MKNEDGDKKVLKLTPIELEGIFKSFGKYKHDSRSRIYREEDFSRHLEELKKKIKKNKIL